MKKISYIFVNGNDNENIVRIFIFFKRHQGLPKRIAKGGGSRKTPRHTTTPRRKFNKSLSDK